MRSEPGREVRLSIGAIAAILVLTALVAINLMQRMTPALAKVLAENVDTMDAATAMVASLASAQLSDAEAAAARTRFSAALEQAARHRTEPREAELLSELRQVEGAAFRGEPLALQRALRALDALGHVNRAAAQRANDEAKRLGVAGAWAVAFLGLFGFSVSAYLSRRLYQRVVAPLHEVERVLTAVQRNDLLQRCATRGFPAHQHQLLNNLNRLLDGSARPMHDNGSLPELSVQLVPWLLDAWGGPLALIDTQGRVLSTSGEARELLTSERGALLRDAMRRVAQGETSPGVATLQRSTAWALVSLSPGD